MNKKGNILIVDDNKVILKSLEILLPIYFERVVTISTPNRLISTLSENPDLDVVLLDMNFNAGINSGNEGLYWLREIKQFRPNCSVVLFTAYAEIELAVTAIKDGAMDFIEKPWDNNKLILTLQNAVNISRSSKRINDLKSLKRNSVEMFWGESKAMNELRRIVEKTAPTDANILITGENGTGKDMLAREIHSLSNRSEELLVTVDMGSVSENLFESELFGHSKGAFTDAKNERSGKFEVASGGTLFLDEIGNIPLHLQSKLLTVIQSRHVTRLGENIPRPIDIRLITATNCSLPDMVEQRLFREDLYYRINTIVLHIPPLRERGDDIIELSQLFLEQYAKRYNKNCLSISPSAKRKLSEHSWPGNIRELQHTIEKGIILSDSSELKADELLINKSHSHSTVKLDTIENMERDMIIRSLKEHSENYSEAAAKLGITRQTLYNKIKKYNL